MQKLEALGVEEGPTHDSLSKKVKEVTDKFDEPIDDPYDVEPTVVEEEVLDNAVMSAFGVAMLQAFGFKELDEESLKKRFDEMAEGTKALHEAAYAMCAEFGDEDCLSKLSEVKPMIAEAEREGYRVAEQIGSIQSRDYEDPEYLEENGEVTLYFEPSPTPGTEDQNSEVSESNESDVERAAEEYDNSASYEPDNSQSDSNEEQEHNSSVEYSNPEE